MDKVNLYNLKSYRNMGFRVQYTPHLFDLTILFFLFIAAKAYYIAWRNKGWKVGYAPPDRLNSNLIHKKNQLVGNKKQEIDYIKYQDIKKII